jgi:hypothetical protein
MSWSAVRREFITSFRTGNVFAAGRNLVDYLPICGSCQASERKVACRHDRPGDARQLVGKRHGNEPRRPALQEPLGPGSQWLGPFVEPPQARRRSEDEGGHPGSCRSTNGRALRRKERGAASCADAAYREQIACAGATRPRRSRGRVMRIRLPSLEVGLHVVRRNQLTRWPRRPISRPQ